MLFIANHIPSYVITNSLEGKFVYSGSTVILSSNTLYLFYPSTKLIKQKFFHEKILQIEKYSLPEKDLILILFKDCRISYVYYDKDTNEFMTYKLKFYQIQSIQSFIRKSKFNYFIKLNKYEYSFLDENMTYKFKDIDKSIKNIKDIIVSDSYVKNYTILTDDSLYFVSGKNYERIKVHDECLSLIKNENFFLIVGKYALYLVKNKQMFKIYGNRIKINHLDDKIISSMNELNNLSIIAKESFDQENDEFVNVYETSHHKNNLKLTNEFYRNIGINNGDIINIDYLNSFICSDDKCIYVIYKNILHTLKVNYDNHRINFVLMDSMKLPFELEVTHFKILHDKFLINDYLFDKNLKYFNKFFTKDLSLEPISSYFADVKFSSKFSYELNQSLKIKNSSKEIIKEISQVTTYSVTSLLTVVVNNNQVRWFNADTFNEIGWANFANFPQMVSFYTGPFILSELKNDTCIKQVYCNEDFLILQDDYQILLYRLINNALIRVTNNTFPEIPYNSSMNEIIYETKNYIFIKTKPIIFFNKNNFIISRGNFTFDGAIRNEDILYNKGTYLKINDNLINQSKNDIKKVEKYLNIKSNEREGLVKIVTEENIFYREKIKEDNSEEDLDEVIDLGARTKRFFVQYYTKSKDEEYFINEYELLEDEFVTKIEKMNLSDLQSRGNVSTFIVVTTSFVKSEEGYFRGRILLFEVINVVPQENKKWTDRRLKILAIEKCKGSVMDCCEVRGLIACCVGTRLLIYEIDRNEGLNCIAFHDTNILCVKVKSVKNYLVVGDLNGVFFFYFQIKPAKIHLLSYEQIYCNDLQLLIYDSKLFIIVKDNYSIKIFTYSPYNLLSKEGQYLIKRSEINLLVDYTVSLMENKSKLYEKIIDKIKFTGGIDLKSILLDFEELITKKMCINEIFYEYLNFDTNKQKEICDIEEFKKLWNIL